MGNGDEVVLPDGKRVTLTKPWVEYTVDELAALGLVPGWSPNGTVDTVSIFIQDERVGAPGATVGDVHHR